MIKVFPMYQTDEGGNQVIVGYWPFVTDEKGNLETSAIGVWHGENYYQYPVIFKTPEEALKAVPDFK